MDRMEGFRTEKVAPLRSQSISAARSRDDDRSATPPSSPGSSSCGSLEIASDGQAPLRQEKVKRVKKTKRVRRKREVVVEDAKVRIGRFFLTVSCFAPFYFLWTMRGMNEVVEELGGLQFLLYLLPIGCVLLAATRETLNIHSISFLYPLLSFGTGIVGGCYSYQAMKDQQVLRLLAICFHGIIAGRLRTLSERSPKNFDVNHFGGFVFWLLMGEVCCMLYRNILQELSAAAVAYGLVTVVPLIAAAAPALIISTWCKCVGVERPSSTNANSSILKRCYEAVAWVISAFTPLIIAGSTFLWTLYVMLPMVWERMLFVAPWGVLLEIGSVVSCGKGAKSLFYLESPLDRRRLNHAAAVFVGDR
eukprot:TRINITY_DN5324_c1_g2_i3.p1 TRINITY_DN5324_c1_g2~~TRINITY_DN5324_c1_g2_i3.p1  ORF type:complete len:362 (+),score=56.78 TRINITY_DN5324_c1_g2_i3:57-1142(+)